jgi:hypothetical protein
MKTGFSEIQGISENAIEKRAKQKGQVVRTPM